MREVILHVYDVTNSGYDKTNNTIMQINKIFKDGIGLGGIFHTAVQVLESFSLFVNKVCVGLLVSVLDFLNGNCEDPCSGKLLRVGLYNHMMLIHFLSKCSLGQQVYGDEEWSFGFCEQGTGVFSCPSTQNPMYTYRESINLGKTSFSIFKVNQIRRELSREWPGHSYDLLAKNCNHFCDEFCGRLGVQKLPGWVNRFANAGDTAVEIAGNTAYRFRQAKTEIVSASRVAYRFLAGVASNNSNVAPDSLATLTVEVPDSKLPG
ncbi:UNVERIFIED_CONTAM: hypothetical protein Scaly_0855700 [Sesamum calycinum]|uniref:PPPDE domain-containing protein n=1 Tax=Sesamum calycinum TaxID=2727403 RepID=A0AAW2QWT4_9LAMI